MAEPDDDRDEVALNVLLAEGLDVPTALEANRRGGGPESAGLGSIGSVILLSAAFVAIAILLR